MSKTEIAWPHAPRHLLGDTGTFLVTAATYMKAHHFRGSDRLAVMQRGLFSVARDFGWHLEAWAIFSNHYHFVAHSPAQADDARSLSQMLAVLHTQMARWVNRLDRQPDRKVWHNFWESAITLPRSYFARLNYVHQNPVKHGLVPVASHYPWGSAAWLERQATPAQVRTVYRFKTDKLNIKDDYLPDERW